MLDKGQLIAIVTLWFQSFGPSSELQTESEC